MIWVASTRFEWLVVFIFFPYLSIYYLNTTTYLRLRHPVSFLPTSPTDTHHMRLHISSPSAHHPTNSQALRIISITQEPMKRWLAHVPPISAAHLPRVSPPSLTTPNPNISTVLLRNKVQVCSRPIRGTAPCIAKWQLVTVYSHVLHFSIALRRKSGDAYK